MSTLLLLTSTTQPSAEVLPALALLPHQVKILPAEGSALLDAPDVDLVLVDGRKELAHARDLCRLLRPTGWSPTSTEQTASTSASRDRAPCRDRTSASTSARVAPSSTGTGSASTPAAARAAAQ